MEIALKDLRYHYRSGREDALDGISAAISPGIHLLLGENGAGKTTLLHIIDGLLFPTGGECRIDGAPTSWRLPSILSQTAFLAPGMEFPAATIDELARIHAQFYPRFSPEMLAENLARFGLKSSDRLRRLSMGSRQKAAVAYILSLRTPVVLLDEPATGLDIESKQTLQQMIAACVEPDQTIIVSTHNIADLQNLYDGVMILNHGRMMLCESTDNVLERIAFTVSATTPDDAIFSEMRMGRCHSIVPNPSGSICSDIDYRLLYLALHRPEISPLLTKFFTQR